MEIRLNLNAAPETSDRLKKAAAKKTAATESLDDAWIRILAMNNSSPDQTRLIEVKNGMSAGLIGRDPAAASKRFSKAEALRLYKGLAESQREGKLADLVKNTPANYHLITTERQFGELLAELKNESIVAVDTETTGVDVYTDVIVGISFSLPTIDKHVYIPVAHENCEQLSREYVLEGLRPILTDEGIGKVFHNAVFDIAMFRRHGSDLKGLAWDTQTAMHLLNENEAEQREGQPKGNYKLKYLAPKYLGVEGDTFDQLFGKNAQFKEVPLDLALVYAAKDTELTWRLYQFQIHHMRKTPTILEYYQSVEIPLLYVIVDMEANGYVLDLDFAKEYGERLHKRANELQAEIIKELAPFHEGSEPLNLNSPPQMRPALSVAIGVELANMDAKKTLKPLEGKYEVVAKLLEYKKITKLSGTYIDALPQKQNPTTKRWHSRYNPMGTVTGRFSSGKDEDDTSGQGFNAQNQPGEARPMFVAPPRKVLVGADFKAQEIRCVAYLSQEPVLIDAFLEGRDPYASMAATFYKRPYEEVYKNSDGSDTKERKQMKVVWLATLYGMSDFSLADMLGVKKPEATQFKKDIFGSMPKLSAWLAENEKFVQKHGYVWADKQARKRRIPDAQLKRKQIPYGKWNDPKYVESRKHNSKINRALRQATNARVQGSSSIQTKVTMVKAAEYCAKKPGWALWGSIHDELVFEVPADFTKEEANDIRDIMVNSYRWGDVVPNGTDVEVMRRWGEGMSTEEFFDGPSVISKTGEYEKRVRFVEANWQRGTIGNEGN
ncbi:DNA polymerase [Peribacillus butanolivorans]|uniref:DNA polymerase n=1 Tax=Peribacillus butanolivorans TaxID=421767 RepID=UPI0025A9D04A